MSKYAIVLLGLLAAGGLQAESRRVNINTAGSRILISLPGIGPALAGRIIAYRKENGPFKKIEDLMNVRGIGEKKFLKLESRIEVGKQRKKRLPKAPESRPPAGPRLENDSLSGTLHPNPAADSVAVR